MNSKRKNETSKKAYKKTKDATFFQQNTMKKKIAR